MDELLKQLNPAQIAILGIVVAGVTELYSRAAAKDYRAVGKIVVAVVTGAAIVLSWRLPLVTAIAIGFVAPGGISILGSIGRKSAAEPSSLTAKAN